jgi:hypothetical protein
MVIKRIDPISCAKVLGITYAFMGIIIGAGVSVIALTGAFGSSGPAAGVGAMFGAGAIVIFPIMYGCIGFVGGLIGAAIYDLAANTVGGISIETQ